MILRAYFGTLDACHVLLKNNAVFPWRLEVPELEEGVEDLDPDRHAQLTSVVRPVSAFVSQHFQPHKLNIACIGNIVRQRPIHVVGRSESAPFWPGTWWASNAKRPYAKDGIEKIRLYARAANPFD